jgi:SAM-dependent methyltransferase
MNKDIQERFEQHYKTNEEPWNYNSSGSERLRFKRVIEIARHFSKAPGLVVDVGCSQGQFTTLLAGYADQTVAIDISSTALQRAEENIKSQFKDIRFMESSLADLDLPAGSVDVIFYLDGINSHLISGDPLQETIKKTHHLLKDKGIIIFTEYMHYSHFPYFREKVASFGLDVVIDERLNDKLWFHVRSWFKAISHFNWVKNMLASESVAAFLGRISALRGEGGSRHICMVAQKNKS